MEVLPYNLVAGETFLFTPQEQLMLSSGSVGSSFPLGCCYCFPSCLGLKFTTSGVSHRRVCIANFSRTICLVQQAFVKTWASPNNARNIATRYIDATAVLIKSTLVRDVIDTASRYLEVHFIHQNGARHMCGRSLVSLFR